MRKKLIRLLSVGISALMVSSYAGGGVLAQTGSGETVGTTVQKELRAVERMETLVNDYKYLNFKQMAQDLDTLLFQFAQNPEYVPVDQDTLTPLGYWDDTHVNMNERMFGIPSYVGHVNSQGAGTIFPGSQEGITTIAAVLSGELAGIDKTNQYGYDFVDMMKGFYNSANNQHFVLNRVNTATGYTFWYELYPQILYTRLYDLVRQNDRMKEIILEGADQWLAALPDFVDQEGNVSFEYTSYDFAAGKPVYNGKWIEPPNAGIAFLLYAAYQLTGNQAYIQGAQYCMDWLNGYDKNPYYEVMSDYASYMAAMMNFKFGTDYDVEKMLNWVFDADSDARPDLGVITGIWGGKGANGLVGSTSDGGGYAFLMNTYHLGSTLAPTAKYDSRFSTAVGRWFLNASNSLRLMYPNEVPAENQIHGGAFAGDPNGVIGYEGVRKTFNGTSPYAMGDPTIYGWGKTNYGLYGSVHVGMFGALIEPTNVEQILRIDLNALDSFKDEGTYPQYLYYNPYPVEKTVQMKLDTPSVLFDTVTNRMISGNVSGTVSISIPAQSSVNVVVLPKDSNVIRAGEEYRVGNRVIAKESAAISILSPDRQKATVSGQVEFQLSVDSREEVESVVLTANGVEVASAKGKTDALTADTTKLANGSTLFQATVRTVGGLTDTSSIKLNVFNESSSEVAYSAGMDEISQYIPVPNMGARAENADGYARITEVNPEGDWGAVETPEFEIDFDREPQLMLDVANLNPVFTVQLKLPDQEYGLYVSANNNSSGQVVLNLKQLIQNYHPGTQLTGKKNVKIYLMANGKESASFDVRQLKVFYAGETAPSEQQGEDRTFTAEEIAQFESGESPGKAELLGKKAIIEDHPSADYGALQSSVYQIDFDTDPTLTVDVEEVSKYWTIQLKVEGEPNAFYISPNNSDVGTFTFNLKEKIALYHPGTVVEGKKNVQVYLMANGAEGCYLIPNSFTLKNGDDSASYTADWKTIQEFASSPAPAKVGMIDAAARITENHPAADYGTVKSTPVLLDLDRDIDFSLRVKAVTARWTVQVKFEGDVNAMYLLADRTDTGDVTVNLKDALKVYQPAFDKTGIQKAWIYLMANGAEGASVDVTSLGIHHAPASVPQELTGLQISPSIFSLPVGGKGSLKAASVPEGIALALSYQSSNPAVAEIDAAGNITAKAVGCTRIVVRDASGISGKAYVRVVEKAGALSPDVLPDPKPDPDPDPKPDPEPVKPTYVPAVYSGEEIQKAGNYAVKETESEILFSAAAVSEIPMSSLENAIKTGKSICIQITDPDGKLQYEWSFEGGSIRSAVDFSPAVAYRDDMQKKIEAITHQPYAHYLFLDQAGKFPVSCRLKVYVGDLFPESSAASLYAYDVKEDKVIPLGSVNVHDQYITFHLDFEKVYFLSDRPVTVGKKAA